MASYAHKLPGLWAVQLSRQPFTLMGGSCRKGFLAFLLATIFLIAIAASAAGFSSRKPGKEYQRFICANLEEVSIKNAAYAAFAKAAREAQAAAKAQRQDERLALRAALQLRAIALQQELSESGFPVAFWCGSPAEPVSLQGVVPKGALPIESPLCLGSFDADLINRKLHFSSIGFTRIEGAMNQSAIFPPCFEVDF